MSGLKISLAFMLPRNWITTLAQEIDMKWHGGQSSPERQALIVPIIRAHMARACGKAIIVASQSLPAVSVAATYVIPTDGPATSRNVEPNDNVNRAIPIVTDEWEQMQPAFIEEWQQKSRDVE